MHEMSGEARMCSPSALLRRFEEAQQRLVTLILFFSNFEFHLRYLVHAVTNTPHNLLRLSTNVRA